MRSPRLGWALLLLVLGTILYHALIGNAAGAGGSVQHLPIARTLAAAPTACDTPRVPTGERWIDPCARLVTIAPATVAPGAQYWHAARVDYRNPTEAQGAHAIRWDVLDAEGARIVDQPSIVTWADGQATVITEAKPAPEWSANYPMYAAGCAYSLSIDGLPSDVVQCLGLGHGEGREWRTDHVEYWITFELRVKE